MELYKGGKYNEALKRINSILKKEYEKRIAYRAVPTGFISTRDTGSSVDLLKVFRERKAEIFFLEENNQLHSLHLTAGRIYNRINRPFDSLNHYFQSLRFKKIEYGKDDTLFYEISQVYKKEKKFNGYINALETAFSLNRSSRKYPLELGRELFRTSKKKRAIYYLKQYLKNEDAHVDPGIYLLLAGLNEDTGNYLETEKYYREYLKEKPGDPSINFALGYLAFSKTGNRILAMELFNKSLEILPEKDIYRRSKSFEYIADISLDNLEYKKAVDAYLNCIRYQEKIEKELENSRKKLIQLNKNILEIKASLLKNSDFDDYSAYEFMMEDRGKIEFEIRTKSSSYSRLNPGKVRWNLAIAYEKSGNLQEAVKQFREAVKFDYSPVKARKKIEKLTLIIQRGY